MAHPPRLYCPLRMRRLPFMHPVRNFRNCIHPAQSGCLRTGGGVWLVRNNALGHSDVAHLRRTAHQCQNAPEHAAVAAVLAWRVAGVTGAAIVPLLPTGRTSSGEAAHPTRVAPASRRGLPLPQPPRARTATTAYGMSALDRGGRIADRAVRAALGWAPGTTLHDHLTRHHLTPEPSHRELDGCEGPPLPLTARRGSPPARSAAR